MNIEDRKREFLSLLRTSYEAQKETIATLTDAQFGQRGSYADEEHVAIKERILKQYGFGDRDFWEIICPSLQAERFLKSFEDPDMSSVYENYFEHIPDYRRLIEKCNELYEELPPSYSFSFAKSLSDRTLTAETSSLRGEEKYRVGRIEKEIEKTKEEIRLLKERGLLDYYHVFIVDKEKISENLSGEQSQKQNEKRLKSLYLVTHSLEPRDPFDVIFLVLDGHYEAPIKCATKNHLRRPTYIKKLYDIARSGTAYGKTPYTKNLATSINFSLFELTEVKKYMQENGLTKISLVGKSKDSSNTLVLRRGHGVDIKTVLVENIPHEYQYLYRDKTK